MKNCRDREIFLTAAASALACLVLVSAQCAAPQPQRRFRPRLSTRLLPAPDQCGWFGGVGLGGRGLGFVEPRDPATLDCLASTVVETGRCEMFVGARPSMVQNPVHGGEAALSRVLKGASEGKFMHRERCPIVWMSVLLFLRRLTFAGLEVVT